MRIEERYGKGDPELAVYRGRTVSLLRKFFRMSTELGHLPSLLGKEFFRTQVTNYGTTTFEDAVIFVHDVEKCLESLDKLSQTVIVRIVLQQYTNEEAAELMDCSARTMDRWRIEAIDALTVIFLKRRLLRTVLAIKRRGLWEVRSEEADVTQKKPMGTVKDIRAMAISA